MLAELSLRCHRCFLDECPNKEICTRCWWMLCLPRSVASARNATECLLCLATTDYLYSSLKCRLKPFIYTARSWLVPKVISVSLYAKELLLEGDGGQLFHLIALHSFLVIVTKKTYFACQLRCQIFPLPLCLWKSPTERDSNLTTELGCWLETFSLPKVPNISSALCLHNSIFSPHHHVWLNCFLVLTVWNLS